jgi:predicted MFS family arabinose efflux permease
MTDSAVPRALPGVGRRHATSRYMLALLAAAYTLSFLDRQIVNILAEAIKKDLGISNLQLGMLTGLAFAVFYTVLGIPIAHAAGRRSRPLIIAGSIALWSVFTIMSGWATGFMFLAMARLGVGIGEAGCNPCAHSLIADTVPPERRASALSLYALGLPIGTMLGLAFGGLVADAFGWRTAFLLAGAPGLVLAAVIALTIEEPRVLTGQTAAGTSFRGALNELKGKRSFWLAALATGLLAFVGYGHGAFFAPFYLRVHGVQITALAQQFGLGPQGFLGIAGALTSGLGSFIGTWLGGVIADRAAVRDKRSYMAIPAVAAALSLPVVAAMYSVDNAALALMLGLIPMMLNALWYGPIYATAQSVVSPQNRAASAAILLFVMNLIGLGLGPICVGALNDRLVPQFGEVEGIRWALLLSAGAIAISSALFWRARDALVADLTS